MSAYFSLHVYLLIVGVFTLLMLALSGVIAPKSRPPAKFLPYESGIRTETHLFQKRFPLRHFLVALMFLIFDIQAIFLYPWATVAKEIGPFALFEIALFIGILGFALFYVVKRGAIDV